MFLTKFFGTPKPTPPKLLPPPREAHAWCQYFHQQARIVGDVLRGVDTNVTPAELQAVGRSVQIFQLGESGQGKHFLACAERYAQQSGDEDYLLALPLFLAEEHRHARDLGRLLTAWKLPLLQKNWTNGIFRWLRHRAGLKLTISVLLSAEVIAQVYYAALREATACPALQRLCRQILRDEAQHVRFQAERLAILRAGHSRWWVAVTQWGERMLFLGTRWVVWRTHHPVFRAAGMNWREYRRRVRRCFARAQTLANPANYAPMPDRHASITEQLRWQLAGQKWLD
ncbi:MAG: hypothetical protein SFX18_12440 [Pirellulales bacterium]|nr:hypothetical protein [Pirellulales bacterium]